jgi:hypothetical protein
MANLTPQQVNELAKQFSAMGKALEDYKRQNFDLLSKQQLGRIKELHGSILKYADDLFTMSAVLVMEDIQSSLTAVNEVTTYMISTYQKLRNIQKAIDIAAAIVNLGKSIVERNPSEILKALGSLSDDINT